jgi:hypothetical protein
LAEFIVAAKTLAVNLDHDAAFGKRRAGLSAARVLGRGFHVAPIGYFRTNKATFHRVRKAAHVRPPSVLAKTLPCSLTA